MSNPYAASAGSAMTTLAGGGASPGRDLPEETMSLSHCLSRLLPYVGGHVWSLALGWACAIASVGCQVLVPILVGRGIDAIVGLGSVDALRLGQALLTLGVVVAAAVASQWLSSWLMGRLCYHVVRDLRRDAYAKVGRLPIWWVEGHAAGDVMARVVVDVDQVGDGLLQGVTQLAQGSVMIVGTLVAMAMTSLPMALVVALAAPAGALVAAGIARASRKSYDRQQALQGSLGARVQEDVANLELLSLFSRGPDELDRFDEANDELFVVGERAQFISSLSNPSTRLVNNLVYAAVAIVGCATLAGGAATTLTVGSVQALLAYAAQFTKPINEITATLSQVQAALASARRVIALLEAPEDMEPVEPVVPETLDGSVCLDHVTFGYEPDNPVLHDVCLEARPGMKVALVGPTGCGKTTLVSLVMRFFEAQAGRVLVDGVDVRERAADELHARMGMVLQDTWVFEGTIAENIAYGREGATREQVEDAAVRARVMSFAKNLPEGLDTVVGERGLALSQGQRQLVCIARAMLADPAILLLDEATSSIDTRTEVQVQAAFDELARGRTSLVVAHRLSTVRDADLICVMDAGRIVERGTHEELLAKGGLYADLCRSSSVG